MDCVEDKIRTGGNVAEKQFKRQGKWGTKGLLRSKIEAGEAGQSWGDSR